MSRLKIGPACAIVIAAALSWPAYAVNTTSGSSYGYVVGQGPIAFFIGNTPGTDTERRYTTEFVPGKSYCLETFRADADYNIDLDLNIQLVNPSNQQAVFTFENQTNSPGDPGLGDNSRWTRGCFVAPEPTGNYHIHIMRGTCCTGRTGTAQLLIVDTTLHAPWWQVDTQGGATAFIRIANTSTAPLDVEVSLRRPIGTVLGKIQKKVIPAFGTVSLAVARAFGVSLSKGRGSAMIAHNGPPGSIIATLSAVNTVQKQATESLFMMRQTH
jgi:hypothetical protein